MHANSLSNDTKDLATVVAWIKEGRFSIPKFQRPFVWKKSYIPDLGDSIIRGYPISSVLLMPKGGLLDVEDSPINSPGIGLNEDNSQIHYILDGQQRLTSISKIFIGNDDENYYFDLLGLLHESFPRDNIDRLEPFATLMKKTNYPKIGDTLCRSFPSRDVSKHNNRFVLAREVIAGNGTSVVSQFIRHIERSNPDLPFEKTDKYLNRLSHLLNIVGRYPIPMTIIDKNADLGVIIRVFEKINSTGMKLTLFDLVNAKSFSNSHYEGKGSFADFIKEDLIVWQEESLDLKNCIDDMFMYKKEQDTFNNLGRIMRAFVVTKAIYDNLSPVTYMNNSYILNCAPDFWFSQWEKNRDNVKKFLIRIAQTGINTNTVPVTFLEYLLGVFLAHPEVGDGASKFFQNAKKFGMLRKLQNKGFNKSDYRVVEQFYEYACAITHSGGYVHSQKPEDLLPEMLFAEIHKKESTKSSVRNIFFEVLYAHNFHGRGMHDLLGFDTRINDRTLFEEHHIFPVSRHKKHEYVNGVANYVLLEKRGNLQEIANREPKEYLNTVQQNYLQENLIPNEPSLWQDFDEFYQERLRMINEYLKGFFQYE